MNTSELERPIVIVGPCAAESREQVLKSARLAKMRGLTILRASLIKPRTEPGFEGVEEKGIPWLEEVAMMGLIPATEVFGVKDAERFIGSISGKLGKKVLPWLGSRNQLHKTQQEIGSMIKGDSNTMLLIKNQPWEDERHWLGIVKHVVHGGADPSQLILCHRGFAPGKDGLRNSPDFEMSMRVKRETGLPMVIDPSHIGGRVDRVTEISHKVLVLGGFDGFMTEVHPNPADALTDQKQQLSWEQFDPILARIQRSNLVLA